jgi:Putative zinc-finger
MSETTENNATNGACDKVLDYAYGELAKAEAAEFEQHLKDCARCQAELALVQRVRSAVKTVLPLVEPPQAATGGLHAQLLHAAALRRPVQRGKVLAFARRVVSHPGYAAAAALLIVGGAVGLQFARGGLQMAAPPAPSVSEPIDAPKLAEGPKTGAEAEKTRDVAKVPATPAPATVAAEDKPADRTTQPLGIATKEDDAVAKDRKKLDAVSEQQRAAKADPSAPDLYLRSATTARPQHHAAAKPMAEPKASADDSGLVFDGKLGPNTDVGHVRERSAGGDEGGTLGGLSRGMGGGGTANGAGRTHGGNSNYRDQQAAEPPPPPSRAEAPAAQPGYAQAQVPQAAPAQSWNAQSPPPPAEKTVAAAPPAPPASNVQSAQNAQGAAALQQSAQKNEQEQAVNNLARSAESLRKKAEELASNGRCDEAVKLYNELEKKYPTFVVAPRDRLPWVRCLRATGNEQMANDLEQLRNDNGNSSVKGAAPTRSFDNESPAQAMRRPAAPAKAKASSKKATRQSDDAYAPTLK